MVKNEPCLMYWLPECPTCQAPADTQHAEDCKLLTAARNFYEDEDNETVVPDDARIEEVGDGWRVEASVYVSEPLLEENGSTL